MIKNTIAFLVLLMSTLFISPIIAQEEEKLAEKPVIKTGSGNFAIGVSEQIWIDHRREEDWTATVGDPREVGLRIFYPTKNNGTSLIPYFSYGTLIQEVTEKEWQEPSPQGLFLKAAKDAPVNCDVKCPLIILSHGLSAGAWTMNQLALDLASNGFIVALPEHAFIGMASKNSKNETIKAEMVNEILGMHRVKMDQSVHEIAEVQSQDQAFIADQFTLFANGDKSSGIKGLASSIDMNKVIVGGHSVGGMAADQSCVRYRVFDGCFSLDGNRWTAILAGWTKPTIKPFLLLLSEAFFEPDQRFAERYLDTFTNHGAAVVEGSRHDTFINLYALYDPESENGIKEINTHQTFVPIIIDFAKSIQASKQLDVAKFLSAYQDQVKIVDFEEMKMNAPRPELYTWIYADEKATKKIAVEVKEK